MSKVLGRQAADREILTQDVSKECQNASLRRVIERAGRSSARGLSVQDLVVIVHGADPH